jgi:hypothetical protein
MLLFVVPAYYADGCDAPWRVQQFKAKKRTRVKLWVWLNIFFLLFAQVSA